MVFVVDQMNELDPTEIEGTRDKDNWLDKHKSEYRGLIFDLLSAHALIQGTSASAKSISATGAGTARDARTTTKFLFGGLDEVGRVVVIACSMIETHVH
ncbi:hypothetical protein Dda_8970 [Drechslerella dactyloides]|uniref:Uncharacterized protein n=1 Tax=Drechslerella dactyloides TaxID=74499 RepID=A0AAD6NFB3_DREDA|nr:hypothetical protein Dda_8970 [Drechslerella dactyloides]